MRAEITNRPNRLPDIEVEATPICGLDFCDSCGDCLECEEGTTHDVCPQGHSWVVYEDISPERAAALLPD